MVRALLTFAQHQAGPRKQIPYPSGIRNLGVLFLQFRCLLSVFVRFCSSSIVAVLVVVTVLALVCFLLSVVVVRVLASVVGVAVVVAVVTVVVVAIVVDVWLVVGGK